MSKRLNAQEPRRSPFSAVIEAHRDSVEVPEAVHQPEGLQPTGKDRIRGKSANAQFIKLTSYIRRDTHQAIKRAMLDENREISELVQELLAKWLKERVHPSI